MKNEIIFINIFKQFPTFFSLYVLINVKINIYKLMDFLVWKLINWNIYLHAILIIEILMEFYLWNLTCLILLAEYTTPLDSWPFFLTLNHELFYYIKCCII